MTREEFALLAVAVGSGFLLLTAAARAAGAAIDPTSSENVFHRGFNAVGDIVNDGEADGDFFASDIIAYFTGLDDDLADILAGDGQ